MDLSGSRLIPAPVAVVRAALRDPETLKACIAGCERLEPAGDDAFEGTVATKVGPIRAALAGRVRATETPDGWTIEAEGADPAAGSGRGRGEVRLEAAESGALLLYEGSAEVEGKIGQLGSRLLSGFARQSIETFLAKLEERAAAGLLPGAGEVPPASSAPSPAPDAVEPRTVEAETPLAEAPPLVHEEAPDPAPTLKAPPLAGEAPRPPLEQIPIAPTAVSDAPDPAAIAAAEAAEGPKEGGGSVGRIMLVAAIVVVVGIAIYFGFLQRPPA